MKTFSITDAGAIREMNQDFYFSSDTAVGNLPNLFIVADGIDRKSTRLNSSHSH